MTVSATQPTGAVDTDLECTNLVKRFDSFTAVDDVSFAIPAGSFFSILGPSGCGKTTLLRMLAGFQEPTSGSIRIKGRDMAGLAPNKRPVNMVFQHLALFPMMTVAENIAYGLQCQKVGKAEIEERVGRVLQRIGLPDSGNKRIDQLSGGQKQRIAIARCLVLEPRVLLLDEPLGALDLKLREHMKVELKQLQHEFGTTFVYITHDQSEALVMSDQVAVMNAGKFEQVGTPRELYYDPATAFVAGFVGDNNRWDAEIVGEEAGKAVLKTAKGSLFHAPTTLAKNSKVSLFVRPEAIALSLEAGAATQENSLTAIVDHVLFDGANSRVLVHDNASGEAIQVALPQTGQFSGLQPGQQVELSWSAENIRCYAGAA